MPGININRAAELLSSSRNIVVLGDIMIDEYLWGKVTRISPEAPIPIVEVNEEHFRPGGSANVAENLKGLGQNVFLFGVVGKDAMAASLKKLLQIDGINTDGVLEVQKRPTTVKTRIIGGNQHLARVDKEITADISAEQEFQLLDKLSSVIPYLDAIILEDYNKGVLTPTLIENVIRMGKENDVLVTADPKSSNFFAYQGVTLFKPNRKEARAALNFELSDEASIDRAGNELLKKLKAESVLITLGSGGMALFSKNDDPFLLPTHARDVADVSGAGDTVISTLTTVLANSGSTREAVMIANIAAGIVCGSVGVVPVSTSEILDQVK